MNKRISYVCNMIFTYINSSNIFKHAKYYHKLYFPWYRTDLQKLSVTLTFYFTPSSTFLLSSPGNHQGTLLFWYWIFKVLHINGINQYFSFQDSHILLITHLSQCIHVTMTIFSFVHKLESIPFCVCIYLSKETYWFHLFIMNTVIMKMGM